VVLFFGHGLPASDDHARGSWALAAEELTELELAALLRRLPARYQRARLPALWIAQEEDTRTDHHEP